MSDNITDNFAIPSGQDATSWTGKAVYESAVGEARPVSDPDGQIPLGVVEVVDLRAGYVSVVLHGWTDALVGEDIDLSDQLAANGRYAGALAGGGLGAPVADTYILGQWGAEAVLTEGTFQRFFVNPTRNTFPDLG